MMLRAGAYAYDKAFDQKTDRERIQEIDSPNTRQQLADHGMETLNMGYPKNGG